jgi:3-oxoacyl-[acyl-carrier-protein] synthase II
VPDSDNVLIEPRLRNCSVELDPQCRLNYVPNKPQPLKIDYALSNSFGFGGTNGSLVFKRWTE